jgi:hypothetical protein
LYDCQAICYIFLGGAAIFSDAANQMVLVHIFQSK